MLVFLDRGFSFFVIGLLLACRDLTVNMLEIPSGALADSFGRRGAMLTSLVAYIVSFLVLGASTSVALYFVGMILYGVGDTFRTGTHKAMIFEWLRLQGRSDERTSIYGLTRSWSQIGSALSGIIAAIFVLVSGSYAYVFFAAVIPYVFNLINLASYPKALDGEHEKAQTISESMRRLKNSLFKAITNRPLRRILLEAMSWEGFFNAIKDYLQPALQSVAVVGLATFFGRDPTAPSHASIDSLFNPAQKTALLIGPIYAILFLLSAWASRKSHRLVARYGGETAAARILWRANLVVFCALTVAAWFQFNVVLVVGFVLLYMLKNFWRPILISRIDSRSEPHEGATILSIESQAQRSATLVLAPAIGWTIDMVHANQFGGPLWPIGVCGAIIAVAMLVSAPTAP